SVGALVGVVGVPRIGPGGKSVIGGGASMIEPSTRTPVPPKPLSWWPAVPPSPAGVPALPPAPGPALQLALAQPRPPADKPMAPSHAIVRHRKKRDMRRCSLRRDRIPLLSLPETLPERERQTAQGAGSRPAVCVVRGRPGQSFEGERASALARSALSLTLSR